MRKCFAVITAVVLAGCLQLSADSVPIVNPSAEANTNATPTGWTYFANGSFPNATAQTAASRGMVADDGSNLFLLYNAGLTQTLGTKYQSGFKYTMSVDAARRNNLTERTGYGFGLYYDNGGTLTEVASTVGTTFAIPQNSWTNVNLTLTVNPGAACIGKDIVVKLFHAGLTYSTTSDYLDNVRLKVVQEGLGLFFAVSP
jgi:hypothetical protein